MTAPNHITGGIVFTGLFCSFFSINIFANPVFISVTVIGSLLPDIDHTKSWIGKSVYPIAKWLSRNYGHRTITHSLLFLVGVFLISLFIEKNFRANYSISIILFFSILSHFIFDMVTLAGIPLFYPFYKNPCVLPANPEMRIRSGNIRQEGIILFMFCFLTFFMQDLFANGFWSTVNNNFNDVKHQIKEYQKSPNVLNIDYDYTIYQKEYKGKGTYIQASESEIFILSQGKILTLKKDTPGLRIKLLKTSKTKDKIHESTVEINNLKESELNNILKNKFIAAGIIYSNFGTTLANNPLEIKKKFEIENKYNLAFISHIQDTLLVKKEKVIADLELKLKTEENQLINDNKNYYLELAELQEEKNKLNSDLPNYELNEVKKKIIELEKQIENYKPKTNLMISEYKRLLETIKNNHIVNNTYSGNITYIEIRK
ncbi:metal-dependent hydrolase [Flavobacterium degerlachei]|uniref:Inner membrane protein n=1 Tax=Flavobacterium degerlachei TaxID=229203 RepID=A0A1H3GMR1_9FLAO|nr:metal-dependent hydrolase [Flavobacterium degerlachei]SDY04255.1 inner membrane protein [Flavobacterium degerlachei]